MEVKIVVEVEERVEIKVSFKVQLKPKNFRGGTGVVGGREKEDFECLKGALYGGEELDARVGFKPLIDSLKGRRRGGVSPYG